MYGQGITELKRACNTFLDGVEETAQQTGLKVYFRTRLGVCMQWCHTSAQRASRLATCSPRWLRCQNMFASQ